MKVSTLISGERCWDTWFSHLRSPNPVYILPIFWSLPTLSGLPSQNTFQKNCFLYQMQPHEAFPQKWVGKPALSMAWPQFCWYRWQQRQLVDTSPGQSCGTALGVITRSWSWAQKFCKPPKFLRIFHICLS